MVFSLPGRSWLSRPKIVLLRSLFGFRCDASTHDACPALAPIKASVIAFAGNVPGDICRFSDLCELLVRASFKAHSLSMNNLRLLCLSATLLAGCAADRQTAVNTLCGDLQVSQAGRLLESDGLSVTVRRAPFAVLYAGSAQGIFRLHAAMPNSPVSSMRNAPKDLWLIEARPLTREASDLRLAGHMLLRERGLGSSYDAGPERNMLQRLQRPASLPAEQNVVARLDYNEATARNESGKPIVQVDKVHGQPIPGSTWPVLHLTSLVGARAATPSSPQKVSWSSCSVFFE